MFYLLKNGKKGINLAGSRNFLLFDNIIVKRKNNRFVVLSQITET